MALRTQAQLARRRRIEAGIRRAAPFLDVLLAAADRVSRVAGRGQPDPEPPRRTLRADARTTLDGGPERP